MGRSAPRAVGDCPLHNQANAFLAGLREQLLPRPLVHEVEGGLQRVEQAAVERPVACFVVAAVTDEPSLSRILGRQQCFHHVAAF